MASRGNQHCASCIGTLSFPIDTARIVCEEGSIKRSSVRPFVSVRPFPAARRCCGFAAKRPAGRRC